MKVLQHLEHQQLPLLSPRPSTAAASHLQKPATSEYTIVAPIRPNGDQSWQHPTGLISGHLLVDYTGDTALCALCFAGETTSLMLTGHIDDA